MNLNEYKIMIMRDREETNNWITLRDVFEDSLRTVERILKQSLSEIDQIEWEDELARREYWFNKFDNEDLDCYSLEEVYEILMKISENKEKEWKTNG